ncbi:MAG: hypothetical protein HOI51_03300 [Nitrosomonadales bacterium]|nr:hypothetical protein [Nitrosomonadales bacterium]
MNNYARAQERIGREIDTMDLKELIKYLGHTKPLILAMIIENAREELKKRQQAEKGSVSFKVGYFDTEKIIQQEVLKLAKERGYDVPPEDIIN